MVVATEAAHWTFRSTDEDTKYWSLRRGQWGRNMAQLRNTPWWVPENRGTEVAHKPDVTPRSLPRETRAHPHGDLHTNLQPCYNESRAEVVQSPVR